MMDRTPKGFNPAPSTILLLDINSCFATIEQQANSLLRGRPVAVAAYTTDRGCILTASYEAKRFGVKTGMQVYEGKRLCPSLIILPSDPEKYRFVQRAFVRLLSSYAPRVEVKSIDEMIIAFSKPVTFMTALDIKLRIKREIGEWITVSIGIAPNRYLAKLASGFKKPDGLVEIHKGNIVSVLSSLRLEDLPGIKAGNSARLRLFGITTPLAMYQSSPLDLHAALKSMRGEQWWMRLHGWEVDEEDNDADPKTIGHSFAMGIAHTPQENGFRQILYQLVVKMGRRLRMGHFTAQGLHISCVFTDFTYWHKGEKQPTPLFADSDFYRIFSTMLAACPNKPVRLLAIHCYDLTNDLYEQQTLFTEQEKKRRLTQAIDAIHNRYGEWKVIPGRMIDMNQKVLDRIAFGQSRL